MMKFSKEYIEECDCKEIQGLHKKLIFGDIVFWEIAEGKKEHIEVFGITLLDGKINIALKDGYVDIETKDNSMTWLPTGDQLDEEIKKIIIKNKNFAYKLILHCYIEMYYAEIIDYSKSDYDKNYWTVYSKKSNNPLIAKIKLLKQLLK